MKDGTNIETVPPTGEELEEAARGRAETSDAIVSSDAGRKLIIAGPGTGKTYNFRRALEAVGGGGLALTFIKALVADLAGDLGNLAQVNTFHGFCKSLAHRLAIEGLTRRFHYYPPLMILVAEDMRLLGRDVRERDLEGALHNMDDDDGLLSTLLELGAHYDAVARTDVVYRVVAHGPSRVHSWGGSASTSRNGSSTGTTGSRVSASHKR